MPMGDWPGAPRCIIVTVARKPATHRHTFIEKMGGKKHTHIHTPSVTAAGHSSVFLFKYEFGIALSDYSEKHYKNCK